MEKDNDCIIFTTVSNLILPELSIFVVLGFVIVTSRHNCPLFILGYDWFPSNDASFPVSNPSWSALSYLPPLILSKGDGYEGVPKVSLLLIKPALSMFKLWLKFYKKQVKHCEQFYFIFICYGLFDHGNQDNILCRPNVKKTV